MIRANQVESEFMPEGANPFHYDRWSMGTSVAKNIMIMHPSHDSERAGEIYIVNIETGERLHIEFCERNERGMMGLMH